MLGWMMWAAWAVARADPVHTVPMFVATTPPAKMVLSTALQQQHTPPRSVAQTVDGQAYVVQFGTTIASAPFGHIDEPRCACDVPQLRCLVRDNGDVAFLLAEPSMPRPEPELGTCVMQDTTFQLVASELHAPPPWVSDARWVVPVLPDLTGPFPLVHVPRAKRWQVAQGICTLLPDARGPGATVAVHATGQDDAPVPCATSRNSDPILVQRIPFVPFWDREDVP